MASLPMRDAYFFNVAKLYNLCCMTIHNLFSIHFGVTLVDILKPRCAVSFSDKFKICAEFTFCWNGKSIT